MSNAGWYPDPAGAPNTYRYWDGQAWSQETSTDPYGAGQAGQVAGPATPHAAPPAPPTSPAQPPAPEPLRPTPPTPPTPPTLTTQAPAYGTLPPPPQWSPMPGAPTPAPPSGSGRMVAIVAAAVGVVVLLLAIAFVGIKVIGDSTRTAGSRDPFARATPASPAQPTQPGQPAPSAQPLQPGRPLGSVSPTPAQCFGGMPLMSGARSGPTITGGGLTAPSLHDHGYQLDARDAAAFTFLDSPQMVSKVVAKDWISPVVVGALPRSRGFSGVEASARSVIACMAENPLLYKDASALEDVSARRTTVDGHAAFSLVQDIKVADPGVKVAGDTVQVVVVDTGNPQSYGVFVMAVPIGRQPLLSLMRSTAGQLRVR